mgnify:CR=1 FL=1
MPGRTGSMRPRSIHKAALTDAVTPLEESGKKLAYKAAVEGIVLLENDGSLPLKAGKIALYGAGAKKTIKGGTGSGEVNERHAVSVFEGLEQSGFTVTTMRWIEDYDQTFEEGEQEYAEEFRKKLSPKNLSDFMNLMSSPYRYPYGRAIQEKDIEESDTDSCIYVVSRQAGEGADRKLDENEYGLSEIERINIAFCAERYKKLIVVINVGGVFDLNFLNEISGINAVIFMGELGTMGGLALADVISGKQTPSGKLTDTWAKHYRDLPFADEYSYLNGNLDEEYYREGIYVGYRYFDTFGVMPLYCFGYGKSYTEFEIKTMNVTADEKQVQVEVEVTNIGDKYPGKEVVQVYYSAPDGIMEKPTQELAGFAKTKLLAPGEKDVVTITFATTDMASFDAYDAAWVMEEGEYTIRVGNSSRNTEAVAVIDLDEQVTTLQLKRLMRDTIAVRELHHMIPIFDIEFDFGVPAIPFRIMLQAENFKKELVEYEVMRRTLMDKRKDEVLTLEDVKAGNATLDELTAQLTVEEMAELCVGTERRNGDGNVIGSASSSVPGAAGDTTSSLFETRKVPNLIQADGPAGLRLETPCTAIPIATTLAQSWDMELIHRMGELVGEEMKQLHVDLWHLA